ncbi:MAG: hypothetical protein FVQ79_10105 [Planctomycetes bacterium]|nr:hypothetical protein [Planctomycetota bacterium]
MHKIAVNIGVVFLITVNVWAIEDSELKELLSESLNIYNQCEKINSEKKVATEDINKRISYVRSRITWIEKPAYDENTITHYNDNIAMYQSWIEKYEGCIEMSKITNPDERASLAKKYDDERIRILAEELEAAKPFRNRYEKLSREVKDKQEPFEVAMKSYCFLPESTYPDVVSTSVEVPYHTGVFTYKWQGFDKKQLAWAWISLRDKPVIEENAEMLDGKYYVSEHWPHQITVWAGNFRISFHVTKTEWRGREKITKHIKDFIDLNGLAKIDPTRNDNKLDALAMGSLAYAKRYRIIKNEGKAVTKPLTNKRVKVKTWIGRLKKPPADKKQIEKDRSIIVEFKNELATLEGRLEIGTMTDQKDRSTMLAKLEVEKQTLEVEKKKTAKPYDDRIRILKQVSDLKVKESKLNNAMKVYFLEGGNGYEGIGEITTRSLFSKAAIRCSWKDSEGNDLCSAQLKFRNKPVVPKDGRMLDGLYYISGGGDSSNYIYAWAGNFQVYFKVRKKELQGKDKIAKILKQFVDLSGLTKVF